MLVRGASCQHFLSSSSETAPLFRSQVCIRKLPLPSCSLCKSTCLGIDPFAPAKSQAPRVSRAAFLTCRSKAQRTSSFHKSTAQRSLSKATQSHDLQSLKECLKQNLLDDEKASQVLQRFKGSLHQHAEALSKRDVGLEQLRLPLKAQTSKAETGQDSPSCDHPLLDDACSAAPAGSPQTRNKFSSTRNRRPSKRSSSRISARGLDVLDELMASQGRSSRALLESLQSTAASDDEDMPHKDSHGKDTWKPTSDITPDEGVKSNIFASSIEKALSPSLPLKAIKSSLACTSKVRVLEHRSSTLSSEAYSAEVSDVAKPTLRGQEVLLALQKAAIEKAKLKQPRKVPHRRSKPKVNALIPDSGAWRNAKPIVVKPEWALQIDELERRIENLKDPMPSS